MKKILSLCINLLLLIIADAVPLQLIPGDRSVVKKDGATHNISKYYVVPNDFDPNNVTNSTEASQKTTLRMNQSIYSKNIDANITSKAAIDQTNENNTDLNNTDVNLHSGLNEAQVEVATQVSDNIAESTGSVNTGKSLGPDDLETKSLEASDNLESEKLDLQKKQRGDSDNDWINTSNDPVSNQVTGSVNTGKRLDPDDLGNLQVESITNSININSGVPINEINVNNSTEALQIGTSLFVENSTQTFERDVEDEPDELILTKFGIAVQESSLQNQEGFWKLIRLTIDKISDDDELLARIERLFPLLNIFTNLYEAAKLQKPIESMIDSIIDILQMPLVEKSNTSESQSQTDVSRDYDEECLKKCGLKRSKPQLDSNGTYLSETESLKASDNLELEKLDLQRRQTSDSDNDWINTSNDPVSNQVTVSNQPTNILRSQLLVPSNLNVGVPDGYNVRSPIPMPTLNYVTRNNDIQEDPKSKQIILNLAETDKNTDDLPLKIALKLNRDWQKYRSAQNIPWTMQTVSTEDLPWHIEDKMTDNLPWHIEDKSFDHNPFTIAQRTTHTLPWIIGGKGTKNEPWIIKDRADPNWTIEHKIGHSPITLYQYKHPSVITQGGKILLHPNKPVTGTVHSVKHGVKKPYHIYTYVINPAASLYGIPNSGNVLEKIYGMPSSHGGNKIVYTNEHSPSYDEPQFSLSKPTIDINSQTSHSQLKHTNYLTATYDTSNEVNPSTLISETLQDDYQPKYFVEYEPETNHKPAVLRPNILPLDSQTNSDQENEEPKDPEEVLHPGVLIPNVPSNPFESQLIINNNGPVSTASASDSTDTSDVDPDVEGTVPNPYNPNISLNHKQQKNSHLGLISTASSSSEYTNLPDDYDEPSAIYGGETHKHPGLISTASSSSEYTNLPDDHDDPSAIYGGETHKHPGLISTASSSSKYTNLPDDHDEPSAIYGGEIHKHPGSTSTASASSSVNTNLPDEYDEPVYGDQKYQHPGLISSSASSNSKYTNLSDDNDEPSRVYGGETHKNPGLISTASSSSTNLPGEYDDPVYGDQTYHHPGLISSSTSPNFKNSNVADDFDEPNPVYSGQTHKYTGFISKASAHSKYTNRPNNYNSPIPDYGQHTVPHPGLITEVNHYPEYANVVDAYNELIPVYGEELHQHPGFLSKADYNNPADDDEEETDRYPVHIQTPNNVRPTENEDNLQVPHHPYGHTVDIIQPSLIAHPHEKQPTGHNYFKHLKLKLAPTYRLFTLDNLLKLYDEVIKTIEINGNEPDNRALMNFRQIIKIILILAEDLKEPQGSIEWYERIFYIQKNRHPLKIFVYNLIRQRWLHELMLVLHKNDFNLNILQNPRIYSFLGSWQVPHYVQNFIEAKELIKAQHNFDVPEVFDQTFSTQNGLKDKFATHTYLSEEVPEDLENHVTNNVINSYKTPNAGIVLSIAGVEAEPDANAIIDILKKYLHYKSFIEKHENVIIRDNMVEMLNQIILFLREKGYDANTIANLIRKLYTAVYSTEGKGCHTHHTNFAKNMYDVILPVLRRSGR